MIVINIIIIKFNIYIYIKHNNTLIIIIIYNRILYYFFYYYREVATTPSDAGVLDIHLPKNLKSL